MDALQKLQQAIAHIKDAERLIKEATNQNESLDRNYGYVIEIIGQQLNKFSDNSKGFAMNYNTPLIEIVSNEGKSWQNEKIQQMDPAPILQPDRDTYFHPSICNWISNILMSDRRSTNEQLVKAFTEKGISRLLACAIIEGERESCLRQGKKYQIDFSSFEPEDDRIFSASSMFDFAYETGQEAMSAGFIGKKSINNLSLEDHIAAQMDMHEGDGNFERWIPRHKWPKEIPEGSTKKERHKKATQKQKKDNGKRRGL